MLAAAALLQAARASAEEAQPQAEAPAPSRFQLDYGWDDARLRAGYIDPPFSMQALTGTADRTLANATSRPM